MEVLKKSLNFNNVHVQIIYLGCRQGQTICMAPSFSQLGYNGSPVVFFKINIITVHYRNHPCRRNYNGHQRQAFCYLKPKKLTLIYC